MENKFYEQFKLKMEADLEQLIALYVGIFKDNAPICAMLSKYEINE